MLRVLRLGPGPLFFKEWFFLAQVLLVKVFILLMICRLIFQKTVLLLFLQPSWVSEQPLCRLAPKIEVQTVEAYCLAIDLTTPTA